jgi:protein subunit release factor B
MLGVARVCRAVEAARAVRLFSSERIIVPRERLSLSFARSSGAGGQNVNKVNTKAEIRFPVFEAKWMPSDVLERFVEGNRGRINAKGEFFLASETHRTQHANLEDAIARLQRLVDVATVPPKERNEWIGIAEVTKERRKESKRHRSEVKSRRKNRSADD